MEWTTAARPGCVRRGARSHCATCWTHTSGFCYDMWNAGLADYVTRTGTPSIMTGPRRRPRPPADVRSRRSLGIWHRPRLGRQGDRGRVRRSAGCLPQGTHLLTVGMADTAFAPTPDMAERLTGVCVREADGGLAPFTLPPSEPEFHAAGSALIGTAPDYLTFLRMLLGSNPAGGPAILQPATLDLMRQDQLTGPPIRRLETTVPFLTLDLAPPAALPAGWGLGGLVHRAPGPTAGAPAASVGADCSILFLGGSEDRGRRRVDDAVAAFRGSRRPRGLRRL